MIATKTTTITTIALVLAMTTSLLAATPAAFAQEVASTEPEICPGQPWFVLCPANIADASIDDSDALSNTAQISAGDNSVVVNVQPQSDDDTNTITQGQTQTPTQTQSGNSVEGGGATSSSFP